MAFLDNSGDIILDAVLTDIGRKRLAAGNFVITKFALGDEEVNYSLWNSTDPRGSAFYDLRIMQTPLMEALTSDQSIMKSRLMTLTDNSVVYLPVLRLNDKVSGNRPMASATYPGFYLMADSRTYDVNGHADATAPIPGVMLGIGNREVAGGTTHIAVDQGIISGDSGLTVADAMPSGLLESDYIVKVDRRLLHLHGYNDNGTMRMDHQSVDDDGIATYYVVRSNNGPVVVPGEDIRGRIRQNLNDGQLNDVEDIAEFQSYEMFEGPLGSVLRVAPMASPSVMRSETLFDEFGQLSTVPFQWRGAQITKHKYIDTTISISGARTGCSIDVPIRIIKGTDFTQP